MEKDQFENEIYDFGMKACTRSALNDYRTGYWDEELSKVVIPQDLHELLRFYKKMEKTHPLFNPNMAKAVEKLIELSGEGY